MECGDLEVERRVEERVAQFAGWASKHPGKKGQVCLSFYEKRQRQSWFRCALCAGGGLAAGVQHRAGGGSRHPPRAHPISPHLAPPNQCSTAEERLYWEQWLIDVSVAPQPQAPEPEEGSDAAAASALRARRRQRVQAALEEALTAIVQHGGCWAGARGVCTREPAWLGGLEAASCRAQPAAALPACPCLRLPHPPARLPLQ